MIAMGKEFVSSLFCETPESWGLRGDPYFWEELKQRLAGIPLPYEPESLAQDITRIFKEVTGEQLSSKAQPWVEKFAHGGMSSGMVCGSFWLEQAMPLLRGRLEQANEALMRESGKERERS